MSIGGEMFERTRERKGASSCSAGEEGIDGLHPSFSKRGHHSLGLAYAGQRRTAQGSALLGARGSKQRALSANSWQREPSCDCAGLLARRPLDEAEDRRWQLEVWREKRPCMHRRGGSAARAPAARRPH